MNLINHALQPKVNIAWSIQEVLLMSGKRSLRDRNTTPIQLPGLSLLFSAIGRLIYRCVFYIQWRQTDGHEIKEDFTVHSYIKKASTCFQ